MSDTRFVVRSTNPETGDSFLCRPAFRSREGADAELLRREEDELLEPRRWPMRKYSIEEHQGGDDVE